MSDPRIDAAAAAAVPSFISQEAAQQLFAALGYVLACARNPHEDLALSGALEAGDEALARARASASAPAS